MAIALIAEYGEFWPSAISFTGNSRTKSQPARSSHEAKLARSGISPMAQLPRDGIENSGTSTPVWRASAKPVSDMCGFHHSSNTLGENIRFREQADNEKGLVSEVKKEPGVYDNARRFEQGDRQILFRPGRWHTEDRRPARLTWQNLDGGICG